MNPRQLAKAIGENIEGGRLAGRFLASLSSDLLDPDELLGAVLDAQQASPDRFRGFVRRIQTALEVRHGY